MIVEGTESFDLASYYVGDPQRILKAEDTGRGY
jgi:hypothetical protein